MQHAIQILHLQPSVNAVSGEALTDFTFAAAAVASECILDDGLDEMLVACCETGDLLMNCDELSCDNCTGDDNDSMLSCTSDNASPESSKLFYVAGYISFRLQKFTDCFQRTETICNRSATVCASARLVLLKSRGGLQFPSSTLTMLLSLTEQCVKNMQG